MNIENSKFRLVFRNFPTTGRSKADVSSESAKFMVIKVQTVGSLLGQDV